MLKLRALVPGGVKTKEEKWLLRYVVAMDENEHLMWQIEQLEKYEARAREKLYAIQGIGPEYYKNALLERRLSLAAKIVDADAIRGEIEAVIYPLPYREKQAALALYIDGVTPDDLCYQMDCEISKIHELRHNVVRMCAGEIARRQSEQG